MCVCVCVVISLCGQKRFNTYRHYIVHGSNSSSINSSIHKCCNNLSIGHLSNTDPPMLVFCCFTFDLHKSSQNDDEFDDVHVQAFALGVLIECKDSVVEIVYENTTTFS